MSLNVQPGGMFNSYKVTYSPETHKLLKVLMDEVKLTTAQRSQIKESVKNGHPLPVVPRRRFTPSYVDDNLFDLKKNFYFLRRSQDQIMHSGAYEKERYRFLDRIVDHEKEKERLRNLMTYGKNKRKTPAENPKRTAKKEAPKMITPEERMEELVIEIEDRLEFLKDMESMGEAKNYEAVIKQEIAAKLREMEKLDKNAAQKYLQFLGPPKRSSGFFAEANSNKKK